MHSPYGGQVTTAGVDARIVPPDAPGAPSRNGAYEAELSYAFFQLGYPDYRDEHVTPDTAMTYSAFWGCFPAGALVTLADGSLLPIEGVPVGALVRTHTGLARPVSERMCHPHTGIICSIRRTGATDPICATDDHLFWVVRRPPSREWWSADWRSTGRELRYEWVAARDLRQGDFLTEPVRPTESLPPLIEMQVRRRVANSARTPIYALATEQVAPSSALLRLIGYYLAEGWCEAGAVRFALHEDEMDLREKITALMASLFGVGPHIYRKESDGRGITLAFNSMRARTFFAGRFGKGAKSKFLPSWVLDAPCDWQKELLLAFWEGDGCRRAEGYNLASAGRALIEGLRVVCLRLGMVPSLRTERREVQTPGPHGRCVSRTLYTLSLTGKNAERFAALAGEACPNPADRAFSFIANGLAHYPVRSVDRVEVTDLPVYNLEVEGDHSYLVGGVSVHNCVQVIAQSLAGVGWGVFERASFEARKKMPVEDDVAWTLDLQASPEMSAFHFREVLLKDALVTGNGYAEIERTLGGRFLWLHRIDPGRVTPVRPAGQLLYEVKNAGGIDPTYLRPEQVFHLKGMGPDGLVGWSVVAMARKAIRLGLQEERFGSDTFGKGPMPGGFVKVPGNLTVEQRKEFRRSFEEVYSGARNQHRIVVLSNGIEFDPATLPNDDQQFLESRAFQALEICRFFRVPPHKLADLTRATFSNIEEQEREFVTDCLLPWARRLESEADIKLFGPINRGKRFTRLNLDALMRGNSATQTTTVATKVNTGILTVNEGREYFDLNPIEGGDTALIQGAMVRLDDVVNPPEPPPAPALATPPTDPAAPEKGKPDPAAPPDPEALRRVFGALLADAYGRLLRVDADKARRAAKCGKLAEHVGEWYATPRTVEAALRPAFEALALALGRPAEGVFWAVEAALRHVVRCKGDLLERGAAGVGEWETWPADIAEFDLRGLLP